MNRLMEALAVLYDDERRCWEASADYQIEHGIDGRAVAGFAGLLTVCPIVLLPGGRFDLPNPDDETVVGAVIEAIGEDGETTIDLCGWPVAAPTDVRALCGQAPLLGLWAAFNPATYFLDHPLIVHRSPLAWLQADCQGAAVVTPEQAARIFMEIADMGGRIGADNHVHARQLKAHLTAMINRVGIVSLDPIRRAA